MNGCCLFLVTVCLVSVDFSAAGLFWTSARNSNLCFWTSSISNGQTHYMFLHQTTVDKDRSFVLFDSIWNKENILVDCITSNNRAVIKSFSSKCWKARDRPFSDIPDGRFNISMLVEPDGPCVAVGHLPELRVPVRRPRDLESMDRQTIYQNSGESSQKLKRSKRAWMIPGTLWCGSGNQASNFSDLGLFEETDKCCREHDHCDQTIASFEFGYGVFNTNFFTLSHCICDSKFHHCLHNANDSMSDMVGYGYFNLLKMRCFEFSQRMECAERTWWGMCKHSQMTSYALLRDATNYNSTFPIMEDDKLDLSIHHTVSFGDLKVTNELVMSSDIGSEDAREKHSSVSIPQRLSVTFITSQQSEFHDKATESLKTRTTDSSKTETVYSPKTELTDSSKREKTDSPKTNQTDSPHITTDSEQRQTADSQQRQTTDSPHIKTTDSPHIKTTDSQQRQTTDSSQRQTEDSPKADSPQEQTVPHQTLITDSSVTQITDTPKTERDSPKTEATDSTNMEKTDSSKTQTPDSPKTQTRDFPKTTITNSTKAETTDLPKQQPTDSPKQQPTDSPKQQPTDSPKQQPTDLPKMHIHPEMHTSQKGKLDTCESYKDLDSCHYQIPALREKFGLRNAEHTTLYHCNCTARLARELAKDDEVDKVHFWLLDFVSQSCFFLPQNCTGSESCSTSSSNDAPLIERWSKAAAVWRHLAAQRRKAKRFNSRRSKRKDSPIRLHKKCLRMHSKLHKPKTLQRKGVQQLYSK